MNKLMIIQVDTSKLTNEQYDNLRLAMEVQIEDYDASYTVKEIDVNESEEENE